MSSLKEQIVREMIDLLQRAPEGRQIDLGSLVVFLDEEALGWMYGSSLHTYPLYEYCQPYTGWTEAQFQNVIAPLEARLSSHFIQIEFSNPPFSDDDGGHTVIQQSPFGGAAAMAAALVTGGAHGDDEGFDPAVRQELIDLILRCTGQTEVETIIDPGKLQGFLEETIDEMKEGDVCNLQMLWEILLDAPGITQDMLIPAFLLMERENSPVPLELPSLVQKLPAKIRESLLAQIGAEAAPPPPEPAPAANKFQIQRSPEKSAPPKPSTSERPAPTRKPPPKRAEKPKKKTAARPKRGQIGPKARKDGGGGGAVKWILVLLLLAGVGGATYYLLGSRKPPGAVLEGKIVDVMLYRSVFPATEIRIHKRTLHVRVKSTYLGFTKTQQTKIAHKLWTTIRSKNPSIHTMILYKPKGEIFRTFGSR